jgi:hypothetical protein
MSSEVRINESTRLSEPIIDPFQNTRKKYEAGQGIGSINDVVIRLGNQDNYLY